MEYIGILCVPTLMVTILVSGLIKKVKIYDAFIEGAKEGAVTLYRIFPALIGLIASIEMLRASGTLDIITNMVNHFTKYIGIPAETIPLMLMRPISGSGAVAVATDIFKNNGPDSFAGLCASVMMGSTETTFYTIAIYYGSVGITKIRHTAKAALVADFVGMIGSVIAVRLLLL